jgi:two-component system nitrate/nitrite response regulator NarL
MTMKYKTILLVDDHGILREGAALLMRRTNEQLEILEAKSPANAREVLKTQRPDLIFLDMRFPEEPEGGLNLLKWLKEGDDYDDIPVIIMSGEPLDRRRIEDDLLANGAAGFISKTEENGASLFKIVLETMERNATFIFGARPTSDPDTLRKRDAKSLGLLPSHLPVLARHVKGYPYKTIARECNLSVQSVKDYVGEMCDRLDVLNSKALIWEIARAGISLDELESAAQKSKGER